MPRETSRSMARLQLVELTKIEPEHLPGRLLPSRIGGVIHPQVALET